MKVRLLENVKHVGLDGCKGQELELDDKLAIDLEKHGHAEFIDAPKPQDEAPVEQDEDVHAPHKKKKK